MTTRPTDGERINLLVVAYAKEKALVGCRAVAGSAVQFFGALPVSRADYHLRSDAVSIAYRADEFDTQPMVLVSSVVTEQDRRFTSVQQQ